MTENLYSLDAERALVGAALTDAGKFLADVAATDFHDEHLAAIWQAGLEVVGHGDYVDMVTVGERLKRNGRADVPFSTLADLAAGDSSTYHAPSYAAIVRNFAQRRR
jgi:replicative DNA helicase